MALTFIIAFIAGIASFISPCVLPLVPAFLGHIAENKIERAGRAALFYHSLLFVLGFSAVFSLLGVLLNSVLSNVAYEAQIWLGRIAGSVIILFGFHMLGLIKPAFLEKEHKFKVKRFKSKSLTSFVFGAAFAVGWTPCVGAVLGSILALAVSMPGESFILLLAYSLGLGIPFLIVGLFAHSFLAIIQKRSTFFLYFNVIVGILITLLGIFVFTGRLALAATGLSSLVALILQK
ncbi:sulfite exporter TauE/SafE family protein [Candidatus Woesearchaeota archaeon]|nr:sulfite exporter TauE/SafE family protein [Candidatus Woesearchaeota archaeon]